MAEKYTYSNECEPVAGEEEETSPETLDKVRIHMEKMNEAQNEINAISNDVSELDLQRTKVIEEAKEQLKLMMKRYGMRIEVSRSYYAAKEEVVIASQRMNALSKLYNDAVLLRDAAKETLHLSELRLKELQKENPDSIKRNLAWLEQINFGTQKVQDAQEQVERHWEEYQAARRQCQEKEALARVLERKNPRSIRITKDFFSTKEFYHHQQSRLVEERRKKVKRLDEWREIYQTQLNALEMISREVHAGRTARKLLDDSLKRRPTVLSCDVMSIDSSVDLDPHFTTSGLNTPTRLSEDEWTDSDSVGCFSLDETSSFRRRPGMIVNRTLKVDDHPLASR